MRDKYFLSILFMVLVMLVFTIASVSAQEEINVDSMDNEQLTTLLLQILNKLQQEEDPAAETDPETVKPEIPAEATAVPAAATETIEEVFQITIYDNKKLIIEALPEYMFIQPTKESKPEKTGPDSVQLSGKELEDYCTGKCMGYSDFYGINMLDMGCYARCVGDI